MARTLHNTSFSAHFRPKFQFYFHFRCSYHCTGLIQNLGRFCNDFQMGAVTGYCRVGWWLRDAYVVWLIMGLELYT